MTIKEENTKNDFLFRHVGPQQGEIQAMLKALDYSSLEQLTTAAVPEKIRLKKPLAISSEGSESQVLEKLRKIASRNQVFRSYIGAGYYNTHVPGVIQRNILENPGWYTQYTPYQAEISQGRLEALLNFQTLVRDLTGMDIANASLLDEATAAAEAMNLCFSAKDRDLSKAFFVGENCHPQSIELIRTRAKPHGINIIVGDPNGFDFSTPIFGALVQYPATDGTVQDYKNFVQRVHSVGALSVFAVDLLSLTLLRSPNDFGADIVVGSAQRFGVPLGYGGPHAAFMATKDALKRQLPGRIVGVSKDVDGRPAIRLALQTREQHIRREKATSNICTAQVLLAIMSSMYAVYHGPKGLKKIAERVHDFTRNLKQGLVELGFQVGEEPFFDTLSVQLAEPVRSKVIQAALARKINFRLDRKAFLGISLDETVTEEDVLDILAAFAEGSGKPQSRAVSKATRTVLGGFERTTPYLEHPVFSSYHSETEMLRYITRLQSKDLSLGFSMIPLGSCTMKLNATVEMMPVSWPEFAQLHPFAPLNQAEGYQELFKGLSQMLAEATGFDGVSLQPNAGSQGEYSGLLVIKKYHESRGDTHRDVCLIPKSAHGTNPASAALAGLRVVVVDCDSQGNIDLSDLRAKSIEHSKNLAALMVTYPSTHGVFEESIIELCKTVHDNGGQVYMDGANMNAQIGLCRPGDFGPDVCHLNLHKTFAIPHGGGGPGVGPIAVKSHLSRFLPTHPLVKTGGADGVGAVSAAPWGSASILPISWMYIALMGGEGLKMATQVAILNANYIAKNLQAHFPLLYKGKNGLVAHECIVDCRQFKESTGVEVEDIAKRLMDYGFHAPTMSFPVPGTLMIEPTESESKAELDRFCDALIKIRGEIEEIAAGKADRINNVLKNAPHTSLQIASETWAHPYSREKAVFPTSWIKENKFWPAVGRINNVLGDRNLICACPSLSGLGGLA
ncbi:aminomethyl-transferring glycine dehydrogenase [Bdellovibrionota bacterium FG-2]